MITSHFNNKISKKYEIIVLQFLFLKIIMKIEMEHIQSENHIISDCQI